MSYTYHGTSELIALPNRTVQTYPSGLVRVERSFVCRKADAKKYRQQIITGARMPQDDMDVAIDGLFIFPDAAETARDDGFVEFRVTAYGRTNKTGQRVAQLPVTRRVYFEAIYQTYNEFYDPTDPSISQTIERNLQDSVLVDIINPSYKICIPSNEIFKQPSDIYEIGKVFVSGTTVDFLSLSFSAADQFSILNLNALFGGASLAKFSSNLSFQLLSFERTNFGSFDEVSVTYNLILSNIYFGSFSNSASAPARQAVLSVIPEFEGAILDIIKSPNADGVQVTINGVTVSAPYSGSGSAELFGIRMTVASNEYLSLIINGLEDDTTYTGTISAYNAYGASPSYNFAFKTRRL